MSSMAHRGPFDTERRIPMRGSRWAGAMIVVGGVVGGAGVAWAHGPSIEGSSGCSGTDTLSITYDAPATPDAPNGKTVDIQVDGQLVVSDWPVGTPYPWQGPSADSHTVAGAYGWLDVNGVDQQEQFYPPTEVFMAVPDSSCEVSTSTGVPPTEPTVATTVAPEQSTTSTATVIVTTAPPATDLALDLVVNETVCVEDPTLCGNLPATGAASATLLLVASLLALAGMGLLIVRRRPAGN